MGHNDIAGAVFYKSAVFIGHGHSFFAAHTDTKKFYAVFLSQTCGFYRIALGALAIGNQNYRFF